MSNSASNEDYPSSVHTNFPPVAKGVAAVFVTMNRCETAKTCLDRLSAQTLRPERVWVIDNASVDGTKQMLSEASIQNAWMGYETLAENLGNAGGMELALEKMFRKAPRLSGFWTMIHGLNQVHLKICWHRNCRKTRCVPARWSI